MSANHCEACLEQLPGLLDGLLEESAAAELRAHLERCDACRAEHDWLVMTIADLEALGDDIVRHAPEVDLVDAVLRGVREIDDVVAPIPLKLTRPQPWRWAFKALAGAAAAAGIALVAWLAFGRSDDAPHPGAGGTVARRTDDPSRSIWLQELAQRKDRFTAEREKLPSGVVGGMRKVHPPHFAEVATVADAKSLEVKDIVATRRKAFSNESAVAELNRWASLTHEQARKILDDPGVTTATAIAAGQALDTKDAIPALLAVVGRAPQDPYARFALAKRAVVPETQPLPNPFIRPETGSDEPAADGKYTLDSLLSSQDLAAQIDAWRALDPDNALPLYMEAVRRFQQGDAAAALDALRQAQELLQVNPYTSQAAQAREQALVAGGMSPESAHLLAAVTAGNQEYNFLYRLSNDLLEYGRTYAEQNNLTEAQTVFEAVQHLGEQLQGDASYSMEQLAGLDIQREALASLESIYAALGSDAALEQLTTQTLQLFQELEGLRTFFDSLDRIFESEDALWSLVADVILNDGDLSLSDYLNTQSP